MQIKPIAPTWRGDENGPRSIERGGSILVETAAATSRRDYDWGRKQTFALNVLEIGKLLTRGRDELTFVHDPNKGKVGEGTTVKTFRLSRMNTDSEQDLLLKLVFPGAVSLMNLAVSPAGFFVTVSTRGGQSEGTVSVAVDDSEMAVVDELLRYVSS